jgi:hypothetical protein
MSNTKGEVIIEADGKNYTLKFSVNALCLLEAETGKGFPKLAGELSDPDKVTLTLMRQLVWAGLQEHHRDVTIQLAGDLIVGAGGMTVIMQKISQAIAAAFPEPETAPAGNASRPLARKTAREMAPEPGRIGISPLRRGAA